MVVMKDRGIDEYEESSHVEFRQPAECQERLQLSFAQISLGETREDAPSSSIPVIGEATRAEPTEPGAPSSVRSTSAQASHKKRKDPIGAVTNRPYYS